MLFVALRIAGGHYALAASDVAEVVPLVDLKPVPRAPRAVAGMFDHRGAPVPVIDLSLLAHDTPCRDSMTTRIAIVNYAGGDGAVNRLGLAAEHMTNVFRADAADFEPAGVNPPETPFFGRVIRRPDGIVQLIEVADLLPPEVAGCLFNEIGTRGTHDLSGG